MVVQKGKQTSAVKNVDAVGVVVNQFLLLQVFQSRPQGGAGNAEKAGQVALATFKADVEAAWLC